LCLGKAATNHLFKAMTDAELRAHYGRQEAEASLSPGVAGIKFLLLRTRETSPTISLLIPSSRFDAGHREEG
jgi:hypothetical protein